MVLRRPAAVALPIVAVLVLLATPVAGVRFGESDERILPADDPARTAVEVLRADYPQFSGDAAQIVLRGSPSLDAYTEALRDIAGIDQVGPPRRTGDLAVLTATVTATDPFSDAARDTVRQIRALPIPAGGDLLVGGTTARNLDSLTATADRMPLVAGLLVGATLLLMFLAFGSVLLPVKAVLMSALSLSATFGILVWIFQDGHLSDLLGVTPAPLEVGIVVLMAAVVFGLSTDYEVFLLSRMVEARTRGASTTDAITVGLARTGRVITAAAILLIVVTGAFAVATVTTMRFVGVGMIVALLLDATVVRMLLVPAVLCLLGDAAWWAPGWLRRSPPRASFAALEHPPAHVPAPPESRHEKPAEPARPGTRPTGNAGVPPATASEPAAIISEPATTATGPATTATGPATTASEPATTATRPAGIGTWPTQSPGGSGEAGTGRDEPGTMPRTGRHAAREGAAEQGGPGGADRLVDGLPAPVPPAGFTTSNPEARPTAPAHTRPEADSATRRDETVQPDVPPTSNHADSVEPGPGRGPADAMEKAAGRLIDEPPGDDPPGSSPAGGPTAGHSDDDWLAGDHLALPWTAPDWTPADIVGDDLREEGLSADGRWADGPLADGPWGDGPLGDGRLGEALPGEGPGGPTARPGGSAVPGRVVPADLSAWLPAVPAYDLPTAPSAGTTAGGHFAVSSSDTARSVEDTAGSDDESVPVAGSHPHVTELRPTLDPTARLPRDPRPADDAEETADAEDTGNAEVTDVLDGTGNAPATDDRDGTRNAPATDDRDGTRNAPATDDPDHTGDAKGTDNPQGTGDADDAAAVPLRTRPSSLADLPGRRPSDPTDHDRAADDRAEATPADDGGGGQR
jgi:MMPL family